MKGDLSSNIGELWRLGDLESWGSNCREEIHRWFGRGKVISDVVVTWVGKVGVMSCIAITVGWGLSLQSLLRRRRSGLSVRLGKLEKMKNHISNIDDNQEVGGGGGGGGGGTFVHSIKWGCPSCAVPELQ